jgi:hypothetical protein
MLANEIIAGRWKVTGDCIRFSPSGRLLDGQHRLLAVQLAKKSIQSYVIYNVDEDALSCIDTGIGRRTHDTLTLFNYPSASRLTALVRNLITYVAIEHFDSHTLPRHLGNISTSDVVAVIDQEPDLMDIIRYVGHSPQKAAMVGSPAIIGALFFFFSRIDRELATYYVDRVIDGSALDADSTIYLVRDKLMVERAKYIKMRSAWLKNSQAALWIKGWNALYSGQKQTRKSFRWNPATNEFPFMLGFSDLKFSPSLECKRSR